MVKSDLVIRWWLSWSWEIWILISFGLQRKNLIFMSRVWLDASRWYSSSNMKVFSVILSLVSSLMVSSNFSLALFWLTMQEMRSYFSSHVSCTMSTFSSWKITALWMLRGLEDMVVKLWGKINSLEYNL